MRINTGDSLKSNKRVENKRHTHAQLPLASQSPTGATIPPSPPDLHLISLASIEIVGVCLQTAMNSSDESYRS